jgi:intein/homing endonuclease|tara:strand:+ start:1390 stop:2658 length:1269 start_codon:yes stop_codon:yes gene_type:complete
MKNNKFFKKTLEEGRFNLFDLISIENSPNSWLWCSSNSQILKESYLKALEKESQEKISLKLSKELNCGKSTIGKHLIRLKNSTKESSLPLILIEKICNHLEPKIKNKINKSINILYFTNNLSKPVKAVHFLTEELSEIIGAFVADGYFHKYDHDYYIKITEGNEDSLILLSNKFKRIFGFTPRFTFFKEDNAWTIWIKNKVICRYFENIFSFKPGKKAANVKMPQIIKNSNFDIQRAFVRGIFTFDGCIKTTGNIAFCTRSKTLMNDIEYVLRKDSIPCKITYNKNKDAWNLESSSGRNLNLLRKWKNYFFKNTIKYRKMQFFLNELKITSLSDLESLFSQHYHGRVNFGNIYNAIKQIKKCENRDIIKYLNKMKIYVAKTTLYKYLYLLSQSGLISKENYQVRTNKNAFYRTIYSIQKSNI